VLDVCGKGHALQMKNAQNGALGLASISGFAHQNNRQGDAVFLLEQQTIFLARMAYNIEINLYGY
jgi:hypothetical protein